MFIVTNRTGDLSDDKLEVINGYSAYLYELNAGCDVIFDNTVALANDLRKMSLEEYDKKINSSCKREEYSRYKHYYEFKNPEERVWLRAFAKYVLAKKGELSGEEARRAAYVISYFSMKYGGAKGISEALSSGEIPKSDTDRRWLSYLKDFSHESAGMIDIPALDIML